MANSGGTTAHGSATETDRWGVDDNSVQQASTIAGLGLLSLAVLGAFGELVVLQDLVTEGNATQTANDITDSEGMFRFAIASLFVVVVRDVVVAWGLYTVFEPVHRKLSLLAAWFRVLYSGVFLLAISRLVGVLHILNDAEYLGEFGTEQLYVHALLRIHSFYDIWDAGLILFGLHVLLLGYLASGSEYAPTFLAILLAVAGLD